MLSKRLRMHAEGLDGTGQYNDIARQTTALNSTENAYIKLADTELRLEKERAELKKTIDEILQMIKLLHDDDLETVLIHRYLLFHTVEQTAEIMHYSERTVKYKQSVAIKKLCTLLPCFAP